MPSRDCFNCNQLYYWFHLRLRGNEGDRENELRLLAGGLIDLEMDRRLLFIGGGEKDGDGRLLLGFPPNR